MQVNAQVLASTFTPESQQWIRLGEALGKLLKVCNSTKQPYDQVYITTEGGSSAPMQMHQHMKHKEQITHKLQLCEVPEWYLVLLAAA